jgi:hypothetical protein
MSNSKKEQRMYDERHGLELNDGFNSGRYGNRRKEMARLKVSERKKIRKKLNKMVHAEDAPTTDSVVHYNKHW